ncbi:MAG: hypothetical protein ABIH00_11530 [Armatimonadota bacterium]
MLKKINPAYLIALLLFLIIFNCNYVYASEHQDEADNYLNAIKENVNMLSNWQKGISEASENIKKLEEWLINTAASIKEKVKINISNPVSEKIKELDKIKAEAEEYIKQLQADCQKLIDSSGGKEKETVIRIKENMNLWLTRIKSSGLNEIDYKNDIEKLKEKLKNTDTLQDMLKVNRYEYNRIKTLNKKIQDMIENMTPLSEKIDGIIQRCKTTGLKKEEHKNLEAVSGKFTGSFEGAFSSGSLNFNISDKNVSADWEGGFSTMDGASARIRGRWTGIYDPESGTLGGQIMGMYYYISASPTRPVNMPMNIAGTWRGNVYYKAAGVYITGEWLSQHGDSGRFVVFQKK